MHETSDMVHDALLKSLRRLGSFEPQREGSLQAYLRQAVLNRIRDECRTASRRPGLEVMQDDSARASGPSPLEEVIGRENVERYERALARLSDEDRETIIARLEWGYSFQEMAVALERPSPDAARQALRRAVTRLAQEMSRDA